MDQLNNGFVGIALGTAVIVFRKYIAEHIIKFQNDTFKFGFGKWTVKLSEFICLLGGIFCVILGLLVILGRVQI